MKVAVTGAGGFLGRALVERLLEAGHEPLAIVKSEIDTADFAEKKIESICRDLSDEKSISGIFKGCQAVVHCAAFRMDFGPWTEYQKANIDITRMVMESALKEAVERVVHISTAAIYGNERSHSGTDEESDYGERVIDHYTRSKIEADKIVCGFVNEKKLPAVILRPGYIWGPGDQRIISFLVRSLKANRLFLIGEGENLLSLTYIDNVIEAILLALSNKDAVGRIFNITDGSRVSSRKFINDIISVLGIKYELKSWSYPIAYSLAYFVEWYFRLVRRTGNPPLTRYAARFLYYNAVFDISRAIYDLGYQPKISYKEGLTLVTPYLRSLYYGGKIAR